jgi:hypothetical protein
MIGSHHTILYDVAGVYEWNWWYYTIWITSLSSDEAGARVGLSMEWVVLRLQSATKFLA